MGYTALPREQIQQELTWNAESVFTSPDAWQTEFESIRAGLPALQRYEGQLGKNPATLLEWLKADDDLSSRLRKLYFYAAMSASVDNTNQRATAMESQASGLYGQAAAATAFGSPEILQIGLETLQQWIQQEPGLAPYQQYFDNLFRQQQHVRSTEVEEVVGMASDPFGGVGTTMEILTSSEMEFRPAQGSDSKEAEVGQGTINKLLSDPDRELRRTGWESYADGYLKVRNTLASNYITSVKQDVFNARVRRYPSSLEASLFNNNIPPSVFYNLIDTFKKNLPTWHRYWRVKRQALGVEQLHTYDIWAPLTSNEPAVPYDSAVDMIAAGMQPLGEKYVQTIRRGCLEQRWIDRAINVGKRQGAFSYGAPGTYPFIMMSFTDDIRSLSTLAHELGHSMHSYLSWENQPFVYSHYSLFVAEVASNCNQALVRAHLLKTNQDRDFQLTLIDEAMDNFHRYFFIMPSLARFELEVHQRIEQGKGVTAEDMINLFTDIYEEGYGGEMNIDRERIGITWAQFSHLYAAYYVYQYATGIAGAHAFAKRILDGVPNAAQDYLGFLSAGSSGYALDVLKRAGVDLSTPEAVEAAFGVMEGYIDRIETLTAAAQHA